MFLWVICCGSDCRSHSCSCSSSLCVEWIWSALASSPLFMHLHMNVWVLGWLPMVRSQWLSYRGVWSCHMLDSPTAGGQWSNLSWTGAGLGVMERDPQTHCVDVGKDWPCKESQSAAWCWGQWSWKGTRYSLLYTRVILCVLMSQPLEFHSPNIVCTFYPLMYFYENNWKQMIEFA